MEEREISAEQSSSARSALTSFVPSRSGYSCDRDTCATRSAFEDTRTGMRVYETLILRLLDDCRLANRQLKHSECPERGEGPTAK